MARSRHSKVTIGLPTGFDSGSTPVSLRRRTTTAALWSAGWVIAWIVFHLTKDQCWVYFKGLESVIATSSLLFAWLFVFFALKWGARAVFAVLTLVIIAVAPLEPGNPVAAAESRAANILRTTVTRLEEYRGNAPDSAYPSTLAIETRPYEDRYYNYVYLPLRSHPDGAVDSYLLKATPRRYDCGGFASFSVGIDGKLHVTKQNREATMNDPALN